MENEITIKNWFRSGWGIYKENKVDLIIIALGMQIISLLPVFIKSTSFNSLYLLFNIFLFPIFYVGISFFVLGIVRQDKNNNYASILDPFKRYFRVLGVSFLYGILILVGTVLLVIPGIYFAVKYCLYIYALMDDNKNEYSSLKYSALLTQGYKIKIFIFSLLALILTAPGSIFSISLSFPNASSFMVLLPFYLVTIFIISPWLIATSAVMYFQLSKKFRTEVQQEAVSSPEST